MKQRNHAFDILCGICIIRMVTLHIMAFCGEDKQDWWLEVMRWSFFFMSFFFFKAGYFNKVVDSQGKDTGLYDDLLDHGLFNCDIDVLPYHMFWPIFNDTMSNSQGYIKNDYEYTSI